MTLRNHNKKLYTLTFSAANLPLLVNIECPCCKETIDVTVYKGKESSFIPKTILTYPHVSA